MHECMYYIGCAGVWSHMDVMYVGTHSRWLSVCTTVYRLHYAVDHFAVQFKGKVRSTCQGIVVV